MRRSYIGIVGGMGPVAGVALSWNLICHTIAGKDQDHLPQIFRGSYYRDLPIIDSSVVLSRALIKAHLPGKLKPWQL